MGQSESALHDTAFGSQCFVVDGVHVQSGGGEGSGTGVAPLGGVLVAGGTGWFELGGVGPLLGEPPTPDEGGGANPDDGALPAPAVPVPDDGAVPEPEVPDDEGVLAPVPPDAPQLHESGSGTQLNPVPQLPSLAHGNSYRGVQVRVVTVVHSEGGGGAAQSVFGGHAAPAGAVGHVVMAADSMQTMPSAQSLWALHGPGSHSLICVTSHGGSVGHTCPGAHATAAQPDSATTLQAKPWLQSESCAQLWPACAVPASAATRPEASSESEVGRRRKAYIGELQAAGWDATNRSECSHHASVISRLFQLISASPVPSVPDPVARPRSRRPAKKAV